MGLLDLIDGVQQQKAVIKEKYKILSNTHKRMTWYRGLRQLRSIDKKVEDALRGELPSLE